MALATKKRSRQRRVNIAALGVIAIGVGLGATRQADTQHIDAALETSVPISASDKTPATSAPAITQQTTTTSSSQSSAQARWFLAPSQDQELLRLRDDHLFWAAVLTEGSTEQVIVAGNSASDGALVVYLDEVGIDITDGPEEFSETFHDVEIDGATIRIGSDPTAKTAKAFRTWDNGVVAVLGGGLSEDEALTVALSATVIGGAVHIDESLLPAGFSLVTVKDLGAEDYSSTLSWNEPSGVEVQLHTSPAALSAVISNLIQASRRTDVNVRNTEGVFIQANPGEGPAQLMWTEDDYQFTLGSTDAAQASELDELLAIAESLEPVSQAELADRLGDPFMVDQAVTVAGWLRDDPLPPGWDPNPLVDAIPGSELDLATIVSEYVSCAWGAEWLDAARSGDDERRQTAFEALSNRANWSVVKSTLEIVFDDENDRLASAQTESEIDGLSTEVGCGFDRP